MDINASGAAEIFVGPIRLDRALQQRDTRRWTIVGVAKEIYQRVCLAFARSVAMFSEVKVGTGLTLIGDPSMKRLCHTNDFGHPSVPNMARIGPALGQIDDGCGRLRFRE